MDWGLLFKFWSPSDTNFTEEALQTCCQCLCLPQPLHMSFDVGQSWRVAWCTEEALATPSFSNFESTSKCFLNNAFPSLSISLSFRTRYKVRTAQCGFPSKANSPMRVGTWLHSSLYQGCSHLIDCWSLPSIWSIGSSTKLIGYYPVRLRAHMTKMAGLTQASLCFCTERNSIHAHCPCQECHGKTVNYKTRERHLSALRLLQQEDSEFILLLNV